MNRAAWAAAALVAAASVLLLAPLPFRMRGLKTLTDLMHAPGFALLAVVVFCACRRWLATAPAAALTWTALVAFGAATEIAQGYTGRGPSWQDLLADACGAAAGILLVLGHAAPNRRARRWWPLLAALLILAGEVRPLLQLNDVLGAMPSRRAVDAAIPRGLGAAGGHVRRAPVEASQTRPPAALEPALVVHVFARREGMAPSTLRHSPFPYPLVAFRRACSTDGFAGRFSRSPPLSTHVRTRSQLGSLPRLGGPNRRVLEAPKDL